MQVAFPLWAGTLPSSLVLDSSGGPKDAGSPESRKTKGASLGRDGAWTSGAPLTLSIAMIQKMRGVQEASERKRILYLQQIASLAGRSPDKAHIMNIQG
jgi:hypothetical protein